jgi:hypothetical protein
MVSAVLQQHAHVRLVKVHPIIVTVLVAGSQVLTESVNVQVVSNTPVVVVEVHPHNVHLLI